jgi:predicted house-cleaning noncanonical NTP pyrophosphatase (MazG superfamily)
MSTEQKIIADSIDEFLQNSLSQLVSQILEALQQKGFTDDQIIDSMLDFYTKQNKDELVQKLVEASAIASQQENLTKINK